MVQENIVYMLFGSKLYGTDTELSDTDYKGIYLPTKEDCFLGTIKKTQITSSGNNNSKNTQHDIDSELYSLQHFIHLAYKGEMLVLDMLHAPKNKLISSSKSWELIQKNKKLFYSKNMCGYLGYIKKQIAKYSTKGNRLLTIKTVLNIVNTINSDFTLNDIWDILPLLEYTNKITIPQETRWKFYEICGKKYNSNMRIKEFCEILNTVYNKIGYRTKLASENKGVDWKGISHAFRALYQLEELLITNNIQYPLKKAEFLKDIKKGKYDFEKDNINQMLDTKLNIIYDLLEKSKWPNFVNKSKLNNLILQIYNT